MTDPDGRQGSVIQTRRLHLRAARESDLLPLHALFSNEDVMRYWSCAPHTDIHQTTARLHAMLTSPTNGFLDFVLVLPSPSLPSGGVVIGKAGIWNPSNREIGFMLRPEYWGQGYMAEAFTALLGPNGLFWRRGVEGVVADVDPRNGGSIGILRRFGFVETGRAEKTFETHLGWCDSIYLALKRPVGGESHDG